MMKTWFFRLLLLVWCAALGAAEAVLPEGTPVISKPEHTSKLLLLTMEPMAVELGHSQRVREKKLKFSFKEEREFATIDGDIADLEEKYPNLKKKIFHLCSTMTEIY